MTDTNLRDRLAAAAVVDEPPLTIGLDPVIAAGRRLRRRRRTAYAAGALGSAVLATAAVGVPLALAGHHASTHTLVVTPFAPIGQSAPAGGDTADLTAQQQSIVDAIESASPAGWTFDFASDRWDGARDVEGVVNDGHGDARLLVGVSKPVGSQQVHPCTDSEFAQGVSCVERTLDNGAVLSLRGLVDANGTRYIDVALTHPDGTGVLAEAGNFLIDWPPPYVITPEGKKHLVHISRADPAYTVEQLAKVVIAVDRVTR